MTNEKHLKAANRSDAVIIVLHEIYGVNRHIRQVCEEFSKAGYDVICPDLLGLGKSFDYDMQEEAYRHFINNIGFVPAARQVKQLAMQAKTQYRYVFLLGYSVGATIAWLCSSEDNICDGVIGYYGSRIRDFTNVMPKCPVLLIFPSEEAFDVEGLADSLKKPGVDVHVLNGKHGFGDPFSENYCARSSEEAEKLVDEFLMKILKEVWGEL